ncbi:MAG: HNH endonuclease signature motif containing protein [Bradyrhizobium sp.]|uniref:HNH endonuclease n=1 Tax=Bradyrhizobium sp. TaxID=376 RepID=UPI0029AEBEFD|nr:HNH endonuclease signature motif containing protein [Bradyrhizobium sp.]MDX3965512.1 HNH endonuclease signature motif containing protein [Bradyrhizobium sp.]
MDYQKHIASSKWRRGSARLAELEAAGHRCRLCQTEATPDSPLEVHHRTYENFGNERSEDLTALCRECHREVTNFLRARRYAAVEPKRADVLRLRDLRGLNTAGKVS